MGKLNKGNIISGLVGIVLGTAGTFGGQALFDNNSTQQSPYSSKQEITNFDIVDYDANGDVYITRYGKKYHNEWCSVIQSKETQRVSSSDARKAGLNPCKKCHWFIIYLLR